MTTIFFRHSFRIKNFFWTPSLDLGINSMIGAVRRIFGVFKVAQMTHNGVIQNVILWQRWEAWKITSAIQTPVKEFFNSVVNFVKILYLWKEI